MSQKNKYGIRCPKCEHEQQVDLYDSLNIGEEEELKSALMSNQVNVVECDSCSFQFRVDTNLLYHDPDNNLISYLTPMGQAILGSTAGEEIEFELGGETRRLRVEGITLYVAEQAPA